MFMGTIWLVLQRLFCATFIPVCFRSLWGDAFYFQFLQQQLTETCVHLVITEAIAGRQWQKRLRFCVSDGGGSFAHSWQCC